MATYGLDIIIKHGLYRPYDDLIRGQKIIKEKQIAELLQQADEALNRRPGYFFRTFGNDLSIGFLTENESDRRGSEILFNVFSVDLEKIDIIDMQQLFNQITPKVATTTQEDIQSFTIPYNYSSINEEITQDNLRIIAKIWAQWRDPDINTIEAKFTQISTFVKYVSNSINQIRYISRNAEATTYFNIVDSEPEINQNLDQIIQEINDVRKQGRISFEQLPEDRSSGTSQTITKPERPIETGITVVGGAAAGKSTFAGGLVIHIKGRTELDCLANIHYGDPGEFRRGVLAEMKSGSYPEKTKEEYILGIYWKEGEKLPKERSIGIVDMPGERQDYLLSEGLMANTNKKDVAKKYKGIKQKLTAGEILSLDDWKTVTRYRFIKSNRTIFLYNIYKLLSDDRPDPKINVNILNNRLTHKKERNALILIGCDLINYNPDYFDLNETKVFDTSIFDEDLDHHVKHSNKAFPAKKEDKRQKLINLLNHVNRRDYFDMFGITIPAQLQNPDKIQRDGSGIIKTPG
jgi:hypothetical protein